MKESAICFLKCHSALTREVIETHPFSPLSDTPTPGLAVSTNKLMSWIRCLRRGRHTECAVQGVLLVWKPLVWHTHTHTHIMRGIQMWPLRMHPKVKGILPKHAVARRNTGDALAQQRQDH